MTTTWTTIASNSVTDTLAAQAATSATASATSATAAAASATAASSSATSAASEVALATAQVVLGTAQTALATSQASASATSATASAASLAEFNGIYYGSSGTAPTTSIAAGDIFFNSSSNQLQVWNGSAWQAGVTDTAGLQSADAGLTSISNLTTTADQMLYLTGSDAYAVSTLSAAGRAILDDADAAAQRTTLGAAPVASPSFTGNVTTTGDLAVGGAVTSPHKVSIHTAPTASAIAGTVTSDGTRQIQLGQSGSSYSYNHMGANQNILYTAGGTFSVVANGQAMQLITGTTATLTLSAAALATFGGAVTLGGALTFADGSAQTSAGASTGKAIAMAMVFG